MDKDLGLLKQAAQDVHKSPLSWLHVMVPRYTHYTSMKHVKFLGPFLQGNREPIIWCEKPNNLKSGNLRSGYFKLLAVKVKLFHEALFAGNEVFNFTSFSLNLINKRMYWCMCACE